MKFSNLLVTAFVGSGNREFGIHTTTTTSKRCTGPLGLALMSDLPITQPTAPAIESMAAVQSNHGQLTSWSSPALLTGIQEWLVPSAYAAEPPAPPSQDEIKLLRDAFATFYGLDRDLVKSEEMLTKVVEAWQRQAPDEKAGLYRVRGDCYMALLQPQKAVKDYTTAIDFLQGPGGDLADPEELPTSLLARARAIRSQGAAASNELKTLAAKDYQVSLRLSSREDWDTDAENEEDGASRNPYAAWEWASARRSAGDVAGAAKTHKLASEAFEDIGDKTRAVISQMDEGVDLASLGKTQEANEVIMGAIKNMKKIESGDAALLQRVIAKEAESRIALASAMWDSGDRQEAETMLGTACFRLEQLEEDAQKRAAAKKSVVLPEKLQFSIDDQTGAGLSCSRFKNEKFLTETLDWPEALQKKVNKLQTLK